VHPRWVQYVRGISSGFENALIKIVKPGSSGTYDPSTGQFSGSGSEETVWPAVGSSAPAWVEFIASPSEVDTAPYPSSVRFARVHVDITKYGDTSTLCAGMNVRVVDGGDDAMLPSMEFVIESVSNGSITGQRTLVCTVDQKTRLP